ncbi:MAG: UDP-N-acetylmuramate dehydrogenase [Oscillospiraceae bacterium]|jgi:UDP-N-acetylmuramate dehydrogenase|nr:UDP-N-acetylmuramate dehydrogenase [Oscillospiraceae bacterium]
MTLRKNALLRNLTTFRIGGLCECLYAPENAEEMTELLRTLENPVVLGRGSNILAADAGVSSPVILTTGLNSIFIEGNTVRAGCGVRLAELAGAAKNASLTGFEWAGGIPGSLGGATVMNAGAYGGAMSDVVTEVVCCDGEQVLRINDCRFGYRHSVFLDDPSLTVLEVSIKLSPGDPVEISQKSDDFRRRRNEKQPVNLASAGSFFKRPPGFYAGALIEQCGLKGVWVGGAQVSERHAGFIVNPKSEATCEDVMRLAALVRERVFKETGAELVPEVRLLGDVQWSF